jgi:lipid II:glycine glycyltransferase (peptidoglycan interpeptide bridge formation enzyme)
MAIYKGEAIAAIILLSYNNTVIYQNGASDTNFLWLKPNHFLLWQAIVNSKKDGLKVFNFGKSSPSDKGLIQFKRRWGTNETYLYNYYASKIANEKLNIETTKKYSIGNKIFRIMPEILLIKTGRLLYKHFA